MKRIEIQTKIELFRRELRALESIKINCGTCQHFVHSPVCKKYQAPVPAEVQASGCEEYEYDEIPF